MGRNYRQLSNLYEYQNGRVAQVTMRKHILKRVWLCVCDCEYVEIQLKWSAMQYFMQ